MQAACIKDKTNRITLIENSGIQFLDYDITVDWNDDEDVDVVKYKVGYFKTRKGKSISDKQYIRLIPHPDKHELFLNPLFENDKGSSPQGTDSIELEKSLKLYNGAWFPIPYYAQGADVNYGCDAGIVKGPLNWARARIVEIPINNDGETNPRENKVHYHVTLAFDTKTQDNDNTYYYAPSHKDAQNSRYFSLAWKKDASDSLFANDHGKCFVASFASSIFNSMAPLVFSDEYEGNTEQLSQDKDNCVYKKHYLNVLAFLGGMVKPNTIRLIASSDNVDTPVNVSLILDIGNSRCFGAIVEDNSGSQGNDVFSSVEPLQIRDFNAPDQVYNDAFESCVEFQLANFDFWDNSSESGRLDAFIWPSLARVGHEATRLSSHSSGSDGQTGLNSPKRYLSQFISNPELDDSWMFNKYSYQIPYTVNIDKRGKAKKTLYFNHTDVGAIEAKASWLNRFLSVSGDPLFSSITNNNLLFRYSKKSLMTFTLMEIFLQAMGQMNSFLHRDNNAHNRDTPRRLKNIVLTFPPSMPEPEREIFRLCAYEAVGLIWKCLGYDKTPATEFKFISKVKEMNPPPPEIVLDWDEVQAAQVVYLYNEVIKGFEGDCNRFIQFLRRPDADGRIAEKTKLSNRYGDYDLDVLRIASIDIGGGTTDLVISDYSYPKELASQADDIRVNEVLREGFKIAGDDLLFDIIKYYILEPLKSHLDKVLKEQGSPLGVSNILYQIIGRGNKDKSVHFQKMRKQLVHQLFMKVGYRILSHLEALNSLPKGDSNVNVSGSIKDFILGNEKVDVKEANLQAKDKQAYKLPDEEVLKHINLEISRFDKDFNILDFNLNIDLFDLNRKFVLGSGQNLSKLIDKLCSIVNIYCADILILTGRPTSIPGVRTRILGNTSLSPDRVISMKSYRCGDWYPLTRDGDCIGDPKTTVVVGALLSHLKRESGSNLIDFRYNPNTDRLPSTIRYVGALNREDMLSLDNIFYKARSEAEEIQRNGDGEYIRKKDIEKINLTEVCDSDGFSSILPIKLGCRQFDSPTYPATLLYTIEVYESVEKLPLYIKAKNLKEPSSFEPEDVDTFIQSLSDGASQEIVVKAYEDYKNFIIDLDDDNDVKQYKQKLINVLNEVKAEELRKQQQAQEQSRKEKGFFSKCLGVFSGTSETVKLKEDYEQELYIKYVQEPLDSFIKDRKIVLNRERKSIFHKACNEALEQNCASLYELYSEDLKKLNEIKDSRSPFTIKLNLGIAENGSDPVMQALKFVLDELPPEKRPSIITFSIKDVKNQGNSKWKNYVNLKLQTINLGDGYWIDSGLLVDKN